jgi:hypothetical protein
LYRLLITEAAVRPRTLIYPLSNPMNILRLLLGYLWPYLLSTVRNIHLHSQGGDWGPRGAPLHSHLRCKQEALAPTPGESSVTLSQAERENISSDVTFTPSVEATTSPTRRYLEKQFQTFSEDSTLFFVLVTGLVWFPLCMFCLSKILFDVPETPVIVRAEAKYPSPSERTPDQEILQYRFGNTGYCRFPLSFAEEMIVSEVIITIDSRDPDIVNRIREELSLADSSVSEHYTIVFGEATLSSDNDSFDNTDVNRISVREVGLTSGDTSVIR